MTHSPEDEQTPVHDGADGTTSGLEPTQQIPVERTQQMPTPQVAAPQPLAPQQATEQSPAPQPPVGWGHPAPTQPTQPTNQADPFALLAAYPADGATTTQAAPPPRTQRIWVPVVGAAAAAALIASFATAGMMTLVGRDDHAATTSASSLASIGTASTDTAPVSGSTSNNPNWEKVSAAVSASVVAIEVTTASGSAEGSGVIIDNQGHVLTNNHVVSGASTVQVTLNDGRLYKATIVGSDSTTDLAVVKITNAPSNLSPAALGDSSAVAVGEAVMAVGNPLGLANTVTTGIVSAVDRPVSASAEQGSDVVVTNAIQIDAAINPGNSGGPLFDAQGRVIGITSSIASLSSSSSGQSGSIGLGFAIPINLAQNIAAQLVKSGTAEHAFLGVSLTDGDATADGTTRKGAVIQQVTSGSPASNAGVKVGDVVVAIDGRPVAGAESLTAYVRERTAGSTAKLTVVRNGKVLDVSVTLAAKAATVDQSPSSQQGGSSGQNGSGQNGSGQNGQNPFGGQSPFGQSFGGQG